MNYREKIRKAIACPQFGDETWGEWGILNLEQRRYIKRLLDELDRADNYFKRVYLENKELEQQCKKQKEVIDNVKNWIYIVQNNKDNNHLEAIISTDELDDLLDILKEVSE